jgi:hypothetical protein
MVDIKGKMKGRTKGALAREASKKAPSLDIQWRGMAIRNEDKKNHLFGFVSSKQTYRERVCRQWSSQTALV